MEYYYLKEFEFESIKVTDKLRNLTDDELELCNNYLSHFHDYYDDCAKQNDLYYDRSKMNINSRLDIRNYNWTVPNSEKSYGLIDIRVFPNDDPNELGLIFLDNGRDNITPIMINWDRNLLIIDNDNSFVKEFDIDDRLLFFQEFRSKLFCIPSNTFSQLNNSITVVEWIKICNQALVRYFND